MDDDVLKRSTILYRRRRRVVLEGYDTAQICENGHVITRLAETDTRSKQDYCSNCGARTITHCVHCQRKIRGHLHQSGAHEKVVPKFCHGCGTSYPWTERGVRAAKELLTEANKLTVDERESLSSSLDDLIRETPNTPVAVNRFKKFLPKAGREIAEGIRSILVDIISEAAKKSMWPV